MRSNILKASLTKSALAVSTLLFANGMAMAQSVVTLTATPTGTTLPDGQPVPMWGYACGPVSDGGVVSPTPSRVSCTAPNGSAQPALTATSGWQPPLITVPAGQPLTITLINNLNFTGGPVPTSLVIVGQLGGGLGDQTQEVTMQR